MLMDTKAEKERKKKIALADQAASDAFRKVEPLIVQKNGNVNGNSNGSAGAGAGAGVGNIGVVASNSGSRSNLSSPLNSMNEEVV